MIRITSGKVTPAIRSLFRIDDMQAARCFAVLDGIVQSGKIIVDNPLDPQWAIVQEAADNSIFLGGTIDQTTFTLVRQRWGRPHWASMNRVYLPKKNTAVKDTQPWWLPNSSRRLKHWADKRIGIAPNRTQLPPLLPESSGIGSRKNSAVWPGIKRIDMLPQEYT